MAITLEELEIKFSARLGDIQGQMNTLKGQLAGVENVANKTSAGFANLGRMAKTFLSVYVGRALVSVGKDSLAMANEVHESEDLFEVSMKGMANQARQWSDNLRDTLGLNAFSLRRNIGTMNVMLNSMGVGSKKSYEMAEALTVLAEDMASFYNIDPTEMYGKLQSGMTGMSMPLKQLGIVIDESTIKEQALRDGIIETSREMTQAEKVMARYAAIMAQTSAAQGDLARTITSPANQLRVLSNTVDQAKVAFGQAMQPIQAAAMPVLNAIASAALTAAQAISYLVRTLSGFAGVNVFANLTANAGAKAVGGLADGLKETAKAYKGAGGAARKAGTDIKQAAKDSNIGLKHFDEVNKLTKEAVDGLDGPKDSGGGKGGGVGDVEPPPIEPVEGYGNALEIVSEKVKALAESIRKFWDGLKNSLLGVVVSGAWNTLKSIFENIIVPMGQWFIANPTVIGDALGAIAIAVGTFKIVTGLGAWLKGIGSAIGHIGDSTVKYTGVAGFIHRLGSAIKAHPSLAIAAGVAAGIGLIAIALKRADEAARAKDLEQRFGTIKVGMEDLRTIASQTRTPFVQALGQIAKEYAAIETAAQSISALATQSSTIVFAYALSPEPMDEEKRENVKTTVQKLIDDTFKAFNEAKAFSVGSIPLTFGADSADGAKLIQIDSAAWAIIEAELKSIGEDLDKAVAEYTLNENPTTEQAAAVAKYQQKMADLLREATDISKAEAEVRLHNLKVKFDGKPTLDAETVTNFANVLGEELDKQTGDINAGIDSEMVVRINRVRTAGKIEGLTNAEIQAQVNEIKRIWEEKRNVELQAATLSVGEVYFEGVAQQVAAAYADELDFADKLSAAASTDFTEKAAKKLYGKDWKQKLKQASSDAGIADEISTLASFMYAEAVGGIKLPDKAAEQNAAALLEAMRPTTDKWQSLYSEMKAKGQKVPDWLEQGLRDVQRLQAIANAPTAWNETLQRGTDMYFGGHWVTLAGKSIPQTIIDAIKSVSLHSTGSDFAQGFIDGVSSKYDAVGQAASKLAGRVKASLKNSLEIQSPSRVAMEIGAYVGEGLADGIASMSRRVASAATGLSIDAANALQGDLLNPSLGLSTSSNVAIEAGMSISGAIEAGIERGVQRVMNALVIHMNVDGVALGRATINSINNANRAAGRLLLEF